MEGEVGGRPKAAGRPRRVEGAEEGGATDEEGGGPLRFCCFPYIGKPANFMWAGARMGTPASPNFLFFPITRFRDGILGRPGGFLRIVPLGGALPWPLPLLLLLLLLAPVPLSMTLRFRMIRPRLGSRGFTLRFKIRTVSEKGDTGGRRSWGPPGVPEGEEPELEPEDRRSCLGRGRRDMR